MTVQVSIMGGAALVGVDINRAGKMTSTAATVVIALLKFLFPL
jgi:hypothetical protein